MYEMDNRELEAVRKVIESKRLFRYQPGDAGECDLFEREFSAKIGTTHSIILSSGTNALLAGLLATGIGPGDEVLVPAYTFVATAAAVRLAGAVPVVVNIDATLGISVVDAKNKITPRTKAIIPVHMDGLAADMAAVCAFAQEFNLVVIEDCAQAIGGSFRGRRLGAWGRVGAYSLNDNKNISCGEGGIVVTSDRALYERMFCLQDLSSIFNPLKRPVFQDSARFLGMSMRVSEFQGAIMRVQLERLDDILSRLRERKQILTETLSLARGVRLVLGACAEGDCASSLHLRFEDPAVATAVSKKLIQHGILAAFPTLRPAHVAWKWLDLIQPTEAASVKAGLLPSMEILMSILKYDVNLRLSLDDTRELARNMARLIEET